MIISAAGKINHEEFVELIKKHVPIFLMVKKIIEKKLCINLVNIERIKN